MNEVIENVENNVEVVEDVVKVIPKNNKNVWVTIGTIAVAAVVAAGTGLGIHAFKKRRKNLKAEGQFECDNGNDIIVEEAAE